MKSGMQIGTASPAAPRFIPNWGSPKWFAGCSVGRLARPARSGKQGHMKAGCRLIKARNQRSRVMAIRQRQDGPR